jgi:hypothetical protein
MSKVWLELRYGTGKTGMTLFRLDDPRVIRAFARNALKKAEERAFESEILDPVLGIIDRAELAKLQQVLDLLLPEDGGSHA